MNRFFIFILFCIFVYGKADGQINYPVNAILDRLKSDATAVVRNSSEHFVQQDKSNGIYNVVYVITILNEKGKSYSDLVIAEDDFYELKNFSGEVYDANGKIIKKIAKKDLTTTAYSVDLANSGKRTFYRYHSPVYPYTIKYEYEMKYKNGILIYPTFAPVPGYDVSLEQASYTLQIPTDQKMRYKVQGTGTQPVSNLSTNTYSLELAEFKAVTFEEWVPVKELFPVVYMSPDAFCVAKVCGSMASWEEYGKWCGELLKGQNSLPQKTIDKVIELTQNITDKREKVKILYDYLQKTTRYVAIQLGIGGWQPMKAEEVARTGFGDCKALSNYMKSMLEVADISSYYTVISTRNKRFFPDFASFGQSNHIILMVPLKNDTIFLECTSQQAPFGYISNLSGHDALAVGNDKVFLCTLPEYLPGENEEINRIQIQVNSDGTGGLAVHSTFKNEDFEGLYYALKNADATETNNILSSLLRVHKPTISQIRKEETLEAPPRLDVHFNVTCEDFASQTGTRMFIPLNPSKTGIKDLLTGSSRKYDIDMDVSKFQNDTIRIQIPEGYIVESKPKALEVESPYGYFKSDINEENGKLIYTQTLEIKKGRYSVTEFEEMKKFYNRIEAIQSGRIGFRKND